MFYFWGFIGLKNGKYTAMLSEKSPSKQLSLGYSDWRLSLVDFNTGRDAVNYGNRLISRYKRIKAAQHRLAADCPYCHGYQELINPMDMSARPCPHCTGATAKA